MGQGLGSSKHSQMLSLVLFPSQTLPAGQHSSGQGKSSAHVHLRAVGLGSCLFFPVNRTVIIILNPVLRKVFKIGTVIYLVSSEKVALMNPRHLLGNEETLLISLAHRTQLPPPPCPDVLVPVLSGPMLCCRHSCLLGFLSLFPPGAVLGGKLLLLTSGYR